VLAVKWAAHRDAKPMAPCEVRSFRCHLGEHRGETNAAEGVAEQSQPRGGIGALSSPESHPRGSALPDIIIVAVGR